jgi:hypothetical protein
MKCKFYYFISFSGFYYYENLYPLKYVPSKVFVILILLSIAIEFSKWILHSSGLRELVGNKGDFSGIYL